jgi:pimeloyl-ACP methyl ester carboxylesterase
MPRKQDVWFFVRRAALVAVVFCSAPAPAPAQTHYEGAAGPGSMYEIDVPANWNGDLVLYAHGIVEAALPVTLPTTQDGYNILRSHLLAKGYAVAASSYSSNGWALADAVRRTHQLGRIVARKAGRPRRTFLVGHSMGALAIVKLAEQHPEEYDGVLAMCGPLGGALAELQYAGDARVTFDYYFPNVLPGTAFDVPPGTQYLSPLDAGGPNALFLRVYSALSANPSATFQWATAAQLPFITETELGNAALYVVGFLVRYTSDFIERVNGKMPFDNEDVAYEVNVTTDPGTNAYLSGLLNAGVERFKADRPALRYYERNYSPNGQIDTPLMTLHTTRDPAIPFSHEAMFAKTVAAAGRSQQLVQRQIDRWGHCAFTSGEVDSAFADLVRWVKSGKRPRP